MIRLAALLGLLFSVAFGQSVEDDIVAFVRRLTNDPPPKELRLTVASREESPTDREWMVQAVRTELERRGIAVIAESTVELRVTLSEQAGDALWVGELLDGTGRSPILFRRTEPTAEGESAPPPLALLLQPVFSQAAPILDIAESESHLYVLSESDLALYEGGPGKWQRVARRELLAEPSRFPLGRIMLSDKGVAAYRPGKRCTADLALAGELHCEDSRDWPVDGRMMRVAQGPNVLFSTGIGGTMGHGGGDFFDRVALGEDGRAPVAFALPDGTLAIERQRGARMERLSGYGSHMARLHAACTADALLLMSGEGDATQKDFVQALTVERPIAAIGAPLELPGMAVAMGSTASAARAFVIVRETSADRYVAFYISALCGG